MNRSRIKVLENNFDKFSHYSGEDFENSFSEYFVQFDNNPKYRSERWYYPLSVRRIDFVIIHPFIKSFASSIFVTDFNLNENSRIEVNTYFCSPTQKMKNFAYIVTR